MIIVEILTYYSLMTSEKINILLDTLCFKIIGHVMKYVIFTCIEMAVICYVQKINHIVTLDMMQY